MFDTALLESRKDTKGRGNGAGLPLAIGLHVAVIGAFVGASVWSVGEPAEPIFPIIFTPTSAPPPPKGDGAHVVRSTPRVRHDPSPVSTTIAIPADPEPQPTGPNPDPDPGDGGDDSGTIPGDQNGVDHGTGTLPAVSSGLPGGDGPHVIGGDVKAPLLLSRAEPEYPEAARRAHLDGVVILEAIITAEGGVEGVRILHSANPLLDAAAERAVRQWRYKPATLNGRAVSVYLTVTVTFGLKS